MMERTTGKYMVVFLGLSELFLKPEKPFVLVYESDGDGLSIAWLETEEDLLEVVEEVKGYGCKILYAIEIGSCRDVISEE